MLKLIFGASALLCLSGMPAHSFTLENIAEICHPWSEANFSTNVNPEMELDVGICIGYFGAFREAGAVNCMIKKQVPEIAVSAFGLHNNYSVEQLVQFTLNFKRDNPDKWQVSPAIIASKILPNAKCE